MAGELAHRIAASAIWHGGRCNWVGADPSEGDRRARAVAALGADLYGGTSGVAVFLAEAGARLDDDRLRLTAEGAIRHALEHADRIRPEASDGLYLGITGVAYAAARVGGLLASERTRVAAGDLARAWSRDTSRSVSADVMSGSAGAVWGLITLSRRLEQPQLADRAEQIGDDLLRRCRRTPTGWSWAQPGHLSMHDLCGFAHGAAGIGLALAELFAATGGTRFEHAAQRAFDYERSWLDPQTGTWPDLRGVARTARRGVPLPTAASWCNGAAGIALSRLRAAELLRSATLRADAELALAACAQHGTESMAHAPDDYSLCHGAAGVGDVFLQASLRPEDPRARFAAEIGRRGLGIGTGLPCGVPYGVTPGLFLGLAGIGTFYLRLSDPGVVSPLLVS